MSKHFYWKVYQFKQYVLATEENIMQVEQIVFWKNS